MNYLVIGAGGTGGPLAAYLAQAGEDVTVIARGVHKAAIKRHGMVLETPHGAFSVPVSVCQAEEYRGKPDVVFVCVKGYALDGVIPFLQRICTRDTIVIPLLNIYGTGARLQPCLPESLVTDGCIYIAGEIKAPGTIWLAGDIFRVVFGVREQEEFRPQLETICRDLCEAGVTGILSHKIQRDAMQKFSFVSPMAACGLLHNAKAAQMQAQGQARLDFICLVREVEAIAHAMNLSFERDLTEVNLNILDDLSPGASTSLKRDVDAGNPSELDGLIFQVVRLGREYRIPVPLYTRVAEKLGFSVGEAAYD